MEYDNVCSWQILNKTIVVSSSAWLDQPIDQVGRNPTSCLHEFRAKVMYCQLLYAWLQTLTMTQPLK